MLVKIHAVCWLNQVTIVLLSANLSIKAFLFFFFFHHFQPSIHKEQKERLRIRLLIFTKSAKTVWKQSIDMHISLKQNISTPDVEETVVTSFSWLWPHLKYAGIVGPNSALYCSTASGLAWQVQLLGRTLSSPLLKDLTTLICPQWCSLLVS